MIASLQGTVGAIGLDSLVLEVAGIGYLVRTHPQTLTSARLGQEIRLHTEMVVREDSLTLYGFLSTEETELFRTVQSVSGIGPRIALAVLAVLTPGQFARAVIADDIKTLTSVPGIGPKGAKRLALELRDKVAPFAASEDAAVVPPAEGVDADDEADALAQRHPHAADVVQALVGLGWAERPAEGAVSAVLEAHAEEAGEGASVGDAATLLRLSLRHLGGRQ